MVYFETGDLWTCFSFGDPNWGYFYFFEKISWFLGEIDMKAL